MRDERRQGVKLRFGRQAYGLTKSELSGLHERARQSVEDAIWRSAGAKPPRTERYWAWLASELCGADVVGLRRPPTDWSDSVNGPFLGRVRGDPHDPESSVCRIEYLATGVAVRRIARIVHELAEFLLILKLPTLLDGDEEAGFGIYYGGASVRDVRHELAREIELGVVGSLFPDDSQLSPARRLALSLTAMRWHLNWRNSPMLYKPEIVRCRVNGVDYSE